MTSAIGVPVVVPCRACGDFVFPADIDARHRCSACASTAKRFEALCHAIWEGANFDDDYYRVLGEARFSKDFCLAAFTRGATKRGNALTFHIAHQGGASL